MNGLILETFILVLMVNSVEKHGKVLMNWEIMIRSIIVDIICSNNVGVNNVGVKYGTLLRFWENNGWINPTDLYG